MAGVPFPSADEALVAALERAQRLGSLGHRPIPDVIKHARSFVVAVEGVMGNVVDLGSGGGIPGLVIAGDRPDLHVTLVDRRRKRTDALEREVRRLGWADRVEVLGVDAHDLVRLGRRFDAAVARGFGPPAPTLQLAAALVDVGGVIVISEPPDDGRSGRWPPELLRAAKVEPTDPLPNVVRFRRIGPERSH